MDLVRHLRLFVAVAEHRHFGQAAYALRMTQPPVSQGIQRLERHLGVRLFERDARRVAMTAAGAALLPSALDLLARAERLERDASAYAVDRRVRLGLAADLDGLVGRVVRALTDAGHQAVPHVAGSTALVDRVRDGELDLAVVRHPLLVDGLRAGEVVPLPTRLDGDWSVAGTGLLAASLPLATPPRSHHPAAHDQLVDALRRLGHSGDVVEVGSALEADALVAAGAALRLTPAPPGPEPAPRLPLRVRVVAPVPTERRPDVPHAEVVDVLEDALRRAVPG